MEEKQQKKRPWIFFIVLLAGVASIMLWQSMAQRTASTEGGRILKNINAEESHQLIQEHAGNERFVLLDVRTPKEFKQARLESAINIDFYDKRFKEELNKLDKEKTYLIYCRTGRRSGLALKVMQELGFQEAYNMSGGISAWAAKKLPMTK